MKTLPDVAVYEERNMEQSYAGNIHGLQDAIVARLFSITPVTLTFSTICNLSNIPLGSGVSTFFRAL